MKNIVIEFIGGPNNGKRLCSDSLNEVEAEYARRASWVFGIPEVLSAKPNSAESDFSAYRLASGKIEDRGKQESWSDAQIQATVRYHDYAVTRFLHEGQRVCVTAQYVGV